MKNLEILSGKDVNIVSVPTLFSSLQITKKKGFYFKIITSMFITINVLKQIFHSVFKNVSRMLVVITLYNSFAHSLDINNAVNYLLYLHFLSKNQQ